MKKTITIAIVAIAMMTMILAWNHWQAGKVMTRSRNSDSQFLSEIVVREMPIKKNPIWMLLRYDRYNYQCEFYAPMGMGRPWSTHTYTDDSFSASRARVTWTNGNEATVYLDNLPVLKCTDGWWMKAPPQ
jgi:hypothetical protein